MVLIFAKVAIKMCLVSDHISKCHLEHLLKCILKNIEMEDGNIKLQKEALREYKTCLPMSNSVCAKVLLICAEHSYIPASLSHSLLKCLSLS